MRLRLKRIPVLLAGLLLSASADAQINLTEWPKVQMEIGVADAGGNPMTGLTSAALHVRENGNEVQGVEMKPATGPVSVCLLIDSSGSMYKWLHNELAVLQKFIDKLPPEDELCIANFNQVAYIDLKLTTDRKVVPMALHMNPSGGNALYDAIEDMAHYLQDNAHNRSQAVIVVTDGSDNSSAATEMHARRELKMTAAPPLYVMCLPIDPEERVKRGDLKSYQKSAQDFGKIDGGLVYFPKDLPELEASLDRLNLVLGNRYLLTYSSNNESKDGRERHVDVQLDKEHQSVKSVVRAPEGYYAPR